MYNILPRALALALLASSSAASPGAAMQATSGVEAPDGELRSAVMRMASGNQQLADIYRRSGWRRLWTEATAAALEQALAARSRHGLDRIQFLSDEPTQRSAEERDVRLTAAALRYADALARGYVDPASLHEVYTLVRPDTDLVAGLTNALSTGTLPAWLESLAPQDQAYRMLSDAYLRYRDEDAAESSAPITPSGLIRVGQSDPRVAAIAAQLVESGYLEEDTGSAETMSGATERYSEAMASAVRQLQHDYGIAQDGVIGPDTLKVLNLGPEERARALAVSLERRRWLTRTPPATRIDVNTAAAELRYFRDGQLVDRRKVIVGQSGRETPALLAPIFRLVANPTWTVPKSIQTTELAHVGSAYLASHDMELRDGWLVQRSGPGNALGLVKFDMRDDQAIYLHDTSAPQLFDRSERHLSHGCVRVEDALGFADMLAQDEGVMDAWQQARASGEQSFVALPREIPVRLLYHNVFVSQEKRVAFRTDPYGWNPPIAKALGFAAEGSRRSVSDVVDTGP